MTPRRVARLALGLALAAGGAAHGQAARPAADFVLPEPAERLPDPLAAAVNAVRAEALAAHVALLASPALAGRGLGTPGLAAATEYAAAQLALAGVPPLGATAAGQGALAAYFHGVPLRRIERPGGTLELRWTAGGVQHRRSFEAGVDVLLPVDPTRGLSARVVDAGYGLRESTPARDDYRGLDVRGAVVVVREGLPPGAEWRAHPELLARHTADDAEERWSAKLELARELGAVAVVGIEGDPWASRLQGRDRPWPFAYLGLPDEGEPGPLLVRASPAVGAALAARPEGLTATIVLTGEPRIELARNVVGVIEGSDPELKREAVVVGAHLDHLGTVDGRLHPGADDNASGVSALLEIARVLAAAPARPRRSVVFAFWTGEEEGKFGSNHWVRQPAWPLDRTAAYLNLDMIGHPWLPEEIRKLVADAGLADGAAFLEKVLARPADFVEPGLASWARDLGPVLVRAGRGTGLALHLDWTEGVSGGSDYRAFARARVPFVRFFGNFFPAYHEPGDAAEALDASQVQRVARLALATTWLLADRPRP